MQSSLNFGVNIKLALSNALSIKLYVVKSYDLLFNHEDETSRQDVPCLPCQLKFENICLNPKCISLETPSQMKWLKRLGFDKVVTWI